MKIIYKNETQIFKNGETCKAIEYPLGEKDIDNAIIEITGRYPEKGRATNLECKELAYIIKGFGSVFIEEKEINIEEGDLILIENNEKFFWDGNLTLLISCSPAWSHEQYKNLE